MEKKLTAEPFDNIRQLVRFVNEELIKREDIVSILPQNNQMFLIYYGRE